MGKTFDYEKQQWVSDDKLHLKRMKEQLELLQSERGVEYADFIGINRKKAIIDLKKALKGE
jgi:hypothetical protein